jgi:hypothetical protein
MSTSRIRAGEAFRKVLETDPDTQAAWLRVQARFQAMDLSGIAAAIRDRIEGVKDDLERLCGSRHEELEDWKHLALTVEMPYEVVKGGKYTISDVVQSAAAWIDRKRIEAKLANSSPVHPVEPHATANREATPFQDPGQPDKDSLISFKEAREMTGLAAYELTRACNFGEIRSVGFGKKRRLHAGDVSRLVIKRSEKH